MGRYNGPDRDVRPGMRAYTTKDAGNIPASFLIRWTQMLLGAGQAFLGWTGRRFNRVTKKKTIPIPSRI